MRPLDDGPKEARPHTPVYAMHKFWARRPWSVFRDLISSYSQPRDILLDPFCGGGVTVVEGLSLRRRVVGVDINPLATYVTEMEVRPLHIQEFQMALHEVEKEVQPMAKDAPEVGRGLDKLAEYVEKRLILIYGVKIDVGG